MSEDSENSSTDISKELTERWINDLMRDFPQSDRMMCELAVEKFLHDPEYVEFIMKNKIAKVEKNEKFTYNGVSIE